jgi:tetratricopeptide (TPR) repeat protein
MREGLAKMLRCRWFVAGLVCAITLLVFWPVLKADFVMWDDDIIIYENPRIRDFSISGLAKLFTDVDSMMRYNPLTLVAWNITWRFCGGNAFWYHLGNWLLHGFNAALVFLVLRRLLLAGLAIHGGTETRIDKVVMAAALGALLWSLHPLRVEPVAWCTDRTYCQSLFFLLLSLLAYLRATESDIPTRSRRLWLGASVFLYVISLLSYAIGMTFFIVLLVIDVYPLGRLGGNNGWTTPAARRVLLEKAPYALAAGIIALVTVYIRIQSAGWWEKPVSLAEFGLAARFMQAMYIWACYIWRPWYPVDLSPVYTALVSFNPFSAPFIASTVLVVGTVGVLAALRNRYPLGLALAVCHLALLVPVLGIFEHPHYPSDRYSLLVSLEWSVLLGAWIVSRRATALLWNVPVILSLIAIVMLGILSFRQTRVWNDSEQLFRHMIRVLGKDPYATYPHHRLGNYLARQGRIDEAFAHYEEAIRINPAAVAARHGLAGLLMVRGRLDEAIECLSEAIRRAPGETTMLVHMGQLYAMKDKKEPSDTWAAKALEYYRQAAELDPNFALAHDGLGAMYIRMGRWSEAAAACSRATQLKPDLAKAWYNLGLARLNMDNWPEATEAFRRAVALQPDSADVHYALGLVLLQTGDMRSAWAQYEVLKRLNEEKAAALLDRINAGK